MPEHWLTSLGRKLLDTGSAYVEQVKLVHELQRLPPEVARERFRAYVAGLSEAARAGFSLTLATLSSAEQPAGAKRFLESLREGLATGSVGSRSQPTARVDTPAPAPCNELQQDLELVDQWMALDDESRPDTVDRYVASLDDRQLSALAANLAQARKNIASHIAKHREDEARIAAGRFVEDQMSYRMRRLAGAAPDAHWQAALENYERILSFVEALQRFVSAVDEERRKPKPAAQSSAPVGESGERGGLLGAQGEQLRRFLEQGLADGTIAADRAGAYRRLLEKLDAVQQARARGDLEAEGAVQQTQELIADFLPYLADPGTASEQATPRGRVVLRYAGALKAAAMREIATSPPAATGNAIGALVGDVTKAQAEAASSRDDAALAKVEANLLRPSARAWHELKLTRHALLARPFWQCNESVRSTNTLFYSGGRDLLGQLHRIAADKCLSVDETRPLQNHGQARWDALNACHVAVFDLRLAAEIKTLSERSPKQARELTGSAYELGLAFALGKPVVLLTGADSNLPFDIDLSPVLLDGADDDAQAIAEALDEAFYVPQRDSQQNAIPNALQELDRWTQGHPRRSSLEGMGWLDVSLAKDPAGFSAAARQLLREIDQAQLQLLRPAWPGAQADLAAPRCFHVMPFAPPWANEARDTARDACAQLALAYRRGDEAEDGCIVHAIWDDLCRASVVLVELHGGNLNVMIELGMAHAIGRPVLAVRRSGAPDVRPRHIEKVRVHSYDTSEELTRILTARLRP